MTNDQYESWLMFVTRELLAQKKSRSPTSNAGPRYHEMNTYTIEDEPFSRWMGWRGQDAQEQETDWPADEVKAERYARRSERSSRLKQENAELRKFLISIRSGIDRFLDEGK
jgi:hypothetical protein